MKSCPTCNRTFEDSFAFCLVDGAILSAPYDPKFEPPATVAYPTIASRDPIPPFSGPPSINTSVPQVQPKIAKGRTNSIGIGAAILITLIGGLIVGANWGKWFGNAIPSANSTPIASSSQTLPVESRPVPSPSAQNIPMPKPTPVVAKSLNILGNWSGVFANRDATLYINSQVGNHFTGILKNTKGAIIAVSGDIMPDIRQISIVENRVIEGVKDGPDWILGSNTGAISADGSAMNGSGRDGAGHAYVWSFHK